MHFYELLAEKEVNAKEEIARFEQLLDVESTNGFSVHLVLNNNILKLPPSVRQTYCTIDDFIELNNLESWKIRKKDVEKLVLYIEIILTILKYLKKCVNGYQMLMDNVKKIVANANHLADVLNYEIKEWENTVILVPRNQELQLAENYLVKRNKNLAMDVWHYEHRSMKGNVEQKRAVLQELSSFVEPYLSKMESVLRDNVGFLLNNLNIRHNNLKGAKSNAWVQGLNPANLESWYDKTFVLLLRTIITKNQEGLVNEVEQLRKCFKKKDGKGA